MSVLSNIKPTERIVGCHKEVEVKTAAKDTHPTVDIKIMGDIPIHCWSQNNAKLCLS